MKYRKSLLGCAVLAGVTLLAAAGLAEEEPKGKEGEAPPAAKIQLAVEKYVEGHSDENGMFLFTDPQTGKKLALTLHKVHTKDPKWMGKERHAVATEFVEAASKTSYELDFVYEYSEGWVGKEKELNLESIQIRAVAGEPRYTWEQQEDGTWKQIPAPEEGEERPGMGG